jgi:ABC-2 type transport system permease protein
MLSLLKKEIRGFFSSLTGYIVIVLFLMITSLFLWVFPGEMNIMDAGYATLEPLFFIAPWIFLFLVPAITMRMFAEERKSGTLDLLLTKPLTEMQVILAKYLASIMLVLLSLLPTLIFYISVHLLGNPPGNLDTGGTWGSYIGLFFLAAVYASIGLFASSFTENQIIAFLVSAVLCFLLYAGFDMLSGLAVFHKIESIIIYLGISDHYKSLSRGVIDITDIIYYIGSIGLFLFFTRTVLESRKW